MEYDYGDLLHDALEGAKKRKEDAKTGDEARHWAVLRTELEKSFAYYETYLKPKPVAEGGSE